MSGLQIAIFILYIIFSELRVYAQNRCIDNILDTLTVNLKILDLLVKK